MTPTRRSRVTAAVAVGTAAGAFAAAMALRPGAVPDLLYPLTAGRLFAQGTNPYVAMAGSPGADPPFDAPFFYPFTAVLALLPLARLAVPLACGIFIGVSSALLAWFITRDGLWRLHVFASAPFVVAATLSQFSPLLMLVGLIPAAGFLAALKPHLGLALWAGWPSRRGVASLAAFGVISVLVFPGWPLEWLDIVRHDATTGGVHVAPVFEWRWGGPLLLLSLTAFRIPGARLLAVMSIVPQALFFYDQLLLWLIPRTRRESLWLTASSQVAMILWYLLREPGASVVRSVAPFVILLIYLPALAIIWTQWRASRAPDRDPPPNGERPST